MAHYVPSVDATTLYFKGVSQCKAGVMDLAGTTRLATDQLAAMSIKAIEPGTVHWETRLDRGDFHEFSRLPGLPSTEVGVDFGGLVNAATVTYAIDGVQYVANVAGNSVFTLTPPARR